MPNIPESRPVAFFDFDDTLVFGDSMLHWQRWYARRRRLWAVAPWIWGSVALRLLGKPPVWLKRAYMATANRETPESLENLVRQFSREFLSQCCLSEIVERAWVHHSLGHSIVVVTASPAFYLRNLEDILPPHTLVATELEFHGRNLWNIPRLDGINVKGTGKLDALARAGYEFPLPGSFAYSDHVSDAPLLESVEFAFAVRPDEELEILSRQKGWPILRPVEPWSEGETRLAKGAWLMLGPLGPRWPFLRLPQGKRRRRMWRRWAAALGEVWREAGRENIQGFRVTCRELERLATRLKGAAPRMARALIQKPLVTLGQNAQGGLDRIWATGQALGMPPEGLDALQRMVYQAPGCQAGRLVPAPVSCDGLYQTYRIQRQEGSDRILKLLLPGVKEAVETDLEEGTTDPRSARDPVRRRSWEGLLSEMRSTLRSECDLDRECRFGERLRGLFPDRKDGIWIPRADRVADSGFQGIVVEATDGFPLSAYLSYLRETRLLRDPKVEPSPDYTAFAAWIAKAPPLPQGRELTLRIWSLLSRSWQETGTWLTLSGTEDVRVVPHPDGWLLSMSDFVGVVEFPDWCPHALREWDVVCPEGSSDLEDLCRAMGWGDHHLEAFHGKHRDLVEMVWHPVLRGGDSTGFGFDDWRLDGKLQTLLGAGHQYENWPIPDPCRKVFRTLWWLRRGLASFSGAE